MMDKPEVIVDNLLSGNSHFMAWCAVLDAIDEVDPGAAHRDRNKSAVDNVCDWIRQRGGWCDN